MSSGKGDPLKGADDIQVPAPEGPFTTPSELKEIKTDAPLITIEYYKVPFDLFTIGEHVDSDLYFYYQRQYVLFKSKGATWSDDDDRKLASTAVPELYIKFKSHKEHHEFLHGKLKNILSRPGLNTERKAKVLYEISDPILSTVYKSPNSSDLISSAANYTKHCINYLNEKGSLPELFKLSGDSLTEHAHSLHTSAYAVALGKKIGVKDQTQIFALGLGALLHDIGKSKIDPSILAKPAELDDNEWLLMRQHPEIGEQILYHRNMVPTLARRVVLEHHERVNGKGYPKGIKGIHTFSKIVGIADCFNTLTSNRPYAKSMPPFEALRFMVQTMRVEFDPHLLQHFIEMLSK